jgi:hypothetical protein
MHNVAKMFFATHQLLHFTNASSITNDALQTFLTKVQHAIA